MAHAPFFEAFDAMLQSRYPSLSVSSVLATTLRIHPYELHALLLLCSGSFAVIGSIEGPDSDSEDEDGRFMWFNVVVANTLADLEVAAVELIVSMNTARVDVTQMPWYLDDDGALKIWFCDEGVTPVGKIRIEDAFLPSVHDSASWQSSFTQQYLIVAAYVSWVPFDTESVSGHEES